MAYLAIDGTIETDRLILRRATADDTDAVAALFSDLDIMRSYGTGRTFDRDETLEAIARMTNHYDTYGYCAQMMLRKDDGEIVGMGGLQRGPLSECVQFGCVLAKHAWGNGYAFEAGVALLDYGFSELGLERIEAITPASNASAIAVVHKLGMNYEGVLLRDGTEYAIFALANATTKG